MFAAHPQVLTDPLAAGTGAGRRCSTGDTSSRSG